MGFFVVFPSISTIPLRVDISAIRYHLPCCFEVWFPTFLPTVHWTGWSVLQPALSPFQSEEWEAFEQLKCRPSRSWQETDPWLGPVQGGRACRWHVPGLCETRGGWGVHTEGPLSTPATWSSAVDVVENRCLSQNVVAVCHSCPSSQNSHSSQD